ncbi:Activator of C kinase protein 1 [Nakaseomyces glabratus]|nr:Activator of C kinase protein 1 [Nakaseomyces glabratus]
MFNARDTQSGNRYETHINMYPVADSGVRDGTVSGAGASASASAKTPYPIEDTAIGTLNRIPVFTKASMSPSPSPDELADESHGAGDKRYELPFMLSTGSTGSLGGSASGGVMGGVIGGVSGGVSGSNAGTQPGVPRGDDAAGAEPVRREAHAKAANPFRQMIDYQDVETPPPPKRDLTVFSREAVEFYEVYCSVVADQGNFTPSVQLKWCETLLEYVFKPDFISHYNINAERLKRALKPEEAQKNQKVILEHAFKVLKKLISSRYAPAIYLMGTLYSHQPYLDIKNKTIVTRNDEKALEFYCKAAALSHPESCYRAAVCYEFRRGCDAALSHYECLQRAFQYYTQGAEQSTSCMYKLGMTHLYGLTSMNYAHEEDPRELERIVRQDVPQALMWLSKATEQGSPQACYELGKIYEFTNMPLPIQQVLAESGIQRDTAKALAYYTRCAREYDYPLAQWKLGHCYETGDLDVAVDPHKSIAWYYRSASDSSTLTTTTTGSTTTSEGKTRRGNPMAMLALSGWCLTGSPGVLRSNDGEALRWAQRSSETAQGKLPRAEYVLGFYYERGIGTPGGTPDIPRATAHYRRAQQFPRAVQALHRLAQ